MFRLFPFWRCVFLSRGAQTNNSRFDCPENIFSSVSWVHYIQAIYSKDKCTIACVVLRGGTERPCFCDINKRNYRVQRIEKKTWVTCTNYWQRILYMKGPTMWQNLERKISFLCLFLPSAFLVLFFPHFSIRIFPSASAIRKCPVRACFTDTPLDTVNSEHCFDARIAGWPNLLAFMFIKLSLDISLNKFKYLSPS